MNNFAYIGTVRQGKLVPLMTERPTSPVLRLTAAPASASEGPESAEIPLHEYEGLVVLVRGIDSGEWIHAATVIEAEGKIGSIVAALLLGGKEHPEDVFRAFLGGR